MENRKNPEWIKIVDEWHNFQQDAFNGVVKVEDSSELWIVNWLIKNYNPPTKITSTKQFNMYDAPSEKIFNELRDVAKSIWTNNYSDEFGYVTEKVSKVDSLENIQDNAMVCYRMFDYKNQGIMRSLLSNEAIVYIDKNC